MCAPTGHPNHTHTSVVLNRSAHTHSLNPEAECSVRTPFHRARTATDLARPFFDKSWFEGRPYLASICHALKHVHRLGPKKCSHTHMFLSETGAPALLRCQWHFASVLPALGAPSRTVSVMPSTLPMFQALARP